MILKEATPKSVFSSGRSTTPKLLKVITPRKLKVIRDPSPETPFKDINDLKISALIMPEFRHMTEQKYNSNIPVKKRNNLPFNLTNTSAKEHQTATNKEQQLAKDIMNLKDQLNALEKPNETIVRRRQK